MRGLRNKVMRRTLTRRDEERRATNEGKYRY
jgi:hypothetical protein